MFLWGVRKDPTRRSCGNRSPSPFPRPKRREWCSFLGGRRNLHSHYGATLSFLLLEGGGEELGLAGQVEQAFGQPTSGAGLGQRLEFVDAGQRRCTKHAVDAFLGSEG